MERLITAGSDVETLGEFVCALLANNASSGINVQKRLLLFCIVNFILSDLCQQS